jgi:hypothetical protein
MKKEAQRETLEESVAQPCVSASQYLGSNFLTKPHWQTEKASNGVNGLEPVNPPWSKISTPVLRPINRLPPYFVRLEPLFQVRLLEAVGPIIDAGMGDILIPAKVFQLTFH